MRWAYAEQERARSTVRPPHRADPADESRPDIGVSLHASTEGTPRWPGLADMLHCSCDNGALFLDRNVPETLR